MNNFLMKKIIKNNRTNKTVLLSLICDPLVVHVDKCTMFITLTFLVKRPDEILGRCHSFVFNSIAHSFYLWCLFSSSLC